MVFHFNFMKWSSEFTLNILKHMKSALIIMDREGRIMILNDSARKILGLAPELEVTGKDCKVILHAYPRLSDLFRTSFDMHTLPDRAELEILNAVSGERRTIGFTLSPVLDDDSERLATAMFFKDLTVVEQKETQERIQDRLAALGMMATWLAHEIRNPLASIEVNAGLLHKGEDSPQKAQLFKEILSEVKSLDRIITQTLDFVKKKPINLIECDINEIITESVNKNLYAYHNIDVWYAFSEIGTVLLDAHQIAQALGNIINNSYEAMPDGGTLTISTGLTPSNAGDYVPEDVSSHVVRDEMNIQVAIEDTGEGISEEALDKIFTPFFTTKSGGSGLGMSLAQKIISDHWGFIDVASELGAGTKFIVVLPLYRAGDKGGIYD